MLNINVAIPVNPETSVITGRNGVFHIKTLYFRTSECWTGDKTLHIEAESRRGIIINGGFILPAEIIPDIIKALSGEKPKKKPVSNKNQPSYKE